MQVIKSRAETIDQLINYKFGKSIKPVLQQYENAPSAIQNPNGETSQEASENVQTNIASKTPSSDSK